MRSSYHRAAFSLLPLGVSQWWIDAHARPLANANALSLAARPLFASLRRKSSAEEEEREEAEATAAYEAIKNAHQSAVERRTAAAHEKGGVKFDTTTAAATDATRRSSAGNSRVEDQLRAQVEHLSQELRHSQAVLRQLVALVDRDKHAADLKRLEQTMEGGGGFFIAEDSAMLLRGLHTPGARIVLLENHTYVLNLFNPIHISNTSVAIIGNGATIVGSLVLDKKASLDVSDVFFYAPNGKKTEQLRTLPPGTEPRVIPNAAPEDEAPASEKERYSNARMVPLLSATNGSRLFINRCQLVNGRDGVYLGINASAELRETAIRNCIRGVYEGVGCHAGIAADCRFSGNYYQVVLLGPNKKERLEKELFPREKDQGPVFQSVCAAEEVCPPGFRCVTPVWLRQRRADVVLEQDPIEDVYTDCWLDGKPVELGEDLRTASLSDPVY